MNPMTQSSHAVATANTGGLAGLKAMLNAESVQQQFENALGENKKLFIASIIDLATGDKALQQCDPGALVKEALRAAVLDLPLAKSLGFAYIVVYNNNEKRMVNGREEWVKVPTPTFIPGYKGYIQLAMRSGQYRTLNADFVYEGELRRRDKLSGEIDLSGTRTSDRVIGYFAYFKLLNGYEKIMYMSVEEMAMHAKRYAPGIPAKTTLAELVAKANEPAPAKKVGWMGNFNDMAIKTVVRRLISKYGVMSTKMSSVISDDYNAESKSLAAREEHVQIAASSAAIDLTSDAVEYEDIDTETGEVRNVKPQSAPASVEPESADPY